MMQIKKRNAADKRSATTLAFLNVLSKDGFVPRHDDLVGYCPSAFQAKVVGDKRAGLV